MTLKIEFTIEDKALKKVLADPQLVDGPVKDFLARSSLEVEKTAKELAPVDTGRLRGAITTELAPLKAIIAAAVFYAPYVEFGTRPHFPPPSALQPWARRHGFASAFILARAIAARGTKPHPFMKPALEKSLGRIREFLADAAKEIERRFKSGS